MISPDESADALTKLRLQNSKLLAHRHQLQRQLEGAQTRIVDLEVELESRKKKIKAMQSSFSWQSTAVFRAVRRLFVKPKADVPSAKAIVSSVFPPAYVLLSGLDQTILSNYPPGPVMFRGWCFAEDDRDLFSVRARLTRSAFEATYGLKRADIIEKFPAKITAEFSGWELEIDFQPGEKEISLEVCDASGRWVSFFHGPLQVGLVFGVANYQKYSTTR